MGEGTCQMVRRPLGGARRIRSLGVALMIWEEMDLGKLGWVRRRKMGKWEEEGGFLEELVLGGLVWEGG